MHGEVWFEFADSDARTAALANIILAGELAQPTVAAAARPYLRESVNAVPGSPSGDDIPAKVGNATSIFRRVRRATNISSGRRTDRAARTQSFARHIAHDRGVK